MLLLFVLLSASVQAAALGERFERTLGGSAVPEILKQYGGEYILPIGQRMWVGEVFRRLAEVTERGDVEYTLTVLNSSERLCLAWGVCFYHPWSGECNRPR